MTAEQIAAFVPALALAVCWWLEARKVKELHDWNREESYRLREECALRAESARNAGWEEGRLYEYNRREPKRGPRGRFTRKRVTEAAEEMELES